MSAKMNAPTDMKEVNKTIFSNLIVNDHLNYQLGHAELDPKLGFLILIRFEEGGNQGDLYKTTKMSFVLINAYNNGNPLENYIIHSVEQTPISEDYYTPGMVNFTVKIKPTEDISKERVNILENEIYFENNKLVDFHILYPDYTEGSLKWKYRNIGRHLCKSRTTKKLG